MDTEGSANVLLAALALVLAIVGAVAGWIASHHVEVQAYLKRDRPRLAHLVERYFARIWRLVGRYHIGVVYVFSLAVAVTALGAAAVAAGRYLIGIGPLPNLDRRLLTEIVTHRDAWVTDAARLLSVLGSFPVVAGLTIGVGLAFARRAERWLPLGIMAASTVGGEALRIAVQHFVGRARPPAALMVAPVTGYGFPSGHAIRTIVYAALAYLFARAVRGWGAKVGLWASAVLLIFIVGATRVYLGVHWPTDVLAGWALAALWLAVVLITTATITRLVAASPRVQGPAALDVARRPEERTHATTAEGLADADVRERIARGDVNVTTTTPSRSVGQIVRANVVTRFNALLGALAVIILLTGSPRDALFGFVVVANTVIGIVQEWRAKRVLDRLELLVAARARVLRNGTLRDVPVDEVVLDDLLELGPGDQIPVDGSVVRAEHFEVDESLLTGEAEPVLKRPGDGVLSGSFVVAGNGRAQATRVGANAYAQRLAAEGRRFELTRSELRVGIDRILLFVTWALLPTAALLLVSQFGAHADATSAIHGAIAGVVGMVPEGLVLLTSLAMALAAIRLGRRRVLVQELSAVEGLARIDVLCVDKTGTITDGTIAFERLVAADDRGRDGDPDARAALGALAASEPNPTSSLAAIGAAFPPPPGWHATATAAFSSARKWSGASFDGHGTWILGAPETILSDRPPSDPLRGEAERIAGSGRRVIALARTGALLEEDRATPPSDLEPAALVVLSERLRPDARETMVFFAEQGVTVKVISGDNPRTAAAAAVAAGVPGASAEPLDARALPEDLDALADSLEKATVLGRVVPEQKRAIVAALQRRGHVVAMTGDGVNDVLALKDADLGIAMGSGTTASRAVAQVVLLDDDFAAMPGVVAEGRRLIANVERTSGLFVTKTMYVLLLALAVGVVHVPFPFLPRHLTLAASLTVGIPAFLLALAPNTTRARAGFIGRILRVAIPAGASIAAATLAAYAAARILDPDPLDAARTAAVIGLTAGGWSLLMLLTRDRPFEHLIVGAGVPLALGSALAVPFTRDFFALHIPSPPVILTVTGIAVIAHLLLSIGSRALLRARDASADQG